MNLRNYNLVRYPVLILLALCTYNTVVCTSTVQGKDIRAIQHQREGKRVKGSLRERYNQLLQEMKDKGYDVFEAEALEKKARHAAKEGNRQEARQLREQAISKLESLESENYPAPKLSGNIETSKTVQIELPVKSKVRVIETFPRDTNTISGNVLQNFDYSELQPEDGVVHFSINSPVIVQEYPYTDFKFQNNKAFGATESSAGILGYSESEINSRFDTTIKILSQSGLGLARDFKAYDTRRYGIDPKKGDYNFSRSDYAINATIDNGIDFIGRLTLLQEKKGAGLPKDEPGYINYIKQTVRRYKGRVKYWQTLKEPEPRIRPVGGNDKGLFPEDVVRILKLSYTTIKSIDNDAIVYFPGTGPGFDFGGYNLETYFEKIISLGGAKYFDVLGFNSYKYDVVEQAEKHQNVLKKYGYDKPLWVSQTGATDTAVIKKPDSKSFPGGSPMAQSEHMVKVYARAFAIGVEKVFWGEFIDESQDKTRKHKTVKKEERTLKWESTGLFYAGTWRLKPSYFTHRLLASSLYDFTKAKKIAPNIVKFTFANKSPVYIAWPD